MARETLRILLDRPALDRVRAGQHNFFARVQRAVEGAGWRVRFAESTLARRLSADGYTLYHMEEPTHPRALTCRRVYVGAFWAIEAQAARWAWPVARAAHPGVDGAGFLHRWRARLWPGVVAEDRGHVFVPLQGRLSVQRSFQAMSPAAMLRTLLSRTDRPVIATLHPKEACSAEDLAALSAHPRLSLQRGGSAEVLRSCHAVVTQNSAMAFEGYFLEKPALLFAAIDFHHIAASVPRDGLEAAFAPQAAADFGGYLRWFLEQRINAGRPECEAQILTALRGHGWPI